MSCGDRTGDEVHRWILADVSLQGRLFAFGADGPTAKAAVYGRNLGWAHSATPAGMSQLAGDFARLSTQNDIKRREFVCGGPMAELRYFMWRWQHMFQSLASDNARRLLGPIDSHLKPDAFLIGFRVDDDAEGHELICVSPENCRFQPELFDRISELIKQLASEDPRSQMRCSAPSDPELYEKMAFRDGWRRAVEQILAEQDTSSVFFASEPTPVNGYAVLVIVQLDRARFDSHYRLTQNFVQKGQLRYPVGRSLIETTIESYLDALIEKLQQPDPGQNIPLIRDSLSIQRAAAVRLMRAPALVGGDLMGLSDIFNVCNTISLQKYEGAVGAGRLVFVRRDHPCIKIDLKLRTPVSVRDFRAVRKLLQMGSGKLCLFCDSSEVYGLGTVGDYDPAGEDLFVVRFVKHFVWELLHADHVMMHCREGRPQLRSPGPPAAPVRETLERVFPGQKIDQIVLLAEAVIAQRHGAMLVVTPSAPGEAARLAKQATVVEPFALTPELIDLVTAIDGAVLVDLDGTCHAIGVILDGLASDRCTSSRGARYNSGVRYACQQVDRVVIVKSEDGMANVLPEAV